MVCVGRRRREHGDRVDLALRRASAVVARAPATSQRWSSCVVAPEHSGQVADRAVGGRLRIHLDALALDDPLEPARGVPVEQRAIARSSTAPRRHCRGSRSRVPGSSALPSAQQPVYRQAGAPRRLDLACELGVDHLVGVVAESEDSTRRRNRCDPASDRRRTSPGKSAARPTRIAPRLLRTASSPSGVRASCALRSAYSPPALATRIAGRSASKTNALAPERDRRARVADGRWACRAARVPCPGAPASDAGNRGDWSGRIPPSRTSSPSEDLSTR